MFGNYGNLFLSQGEGAEGVPPIVDAKQLLLQCFFFLPVCAAGHNRQIFFIFQHLGIVGWCALSIFFKTLRNLKQYCEPSTKYFVVFVFV